MAEEIELGTFTVRANNEGGDEVRLADERHGSNLVLRLKSAGKGLHVGQRGTLVFLAEEVAEAMPVTVEVPADKVADLPPEAEVVKSKKK